MCHAGQCLCGVDFVADATNSSCLAVAALDQPCTDTNQCIASLGVGSICYRERCGCDSNHFQFPLPVTNATTGQQAVQNVCERKIGRYKGARWSLQMVDAGREKMRFCMKVLQIAKSKR